MGRRCGLFFDCSGERKKDCCESMGKTNKCQYWDIQTTGNAPAFRFPVLCRTWKPQIGRPWEMGNRLVERGDILWKNMQLRQVIF